MPEPGHPQNVGRAEGTILVVEDNPEVADVTATLLEQIGYRVLRAGDAIEALETIEGGDRIDLVFSDIVMPNGMNGIHLAQEVTERYPAIRVLLTTGYSDVAAAGETRFRSCASRSSCRRWSRRSARSWPAMTRGRAVPQAAGVN